MSESIKCTLVKYQRMMAAKAWRLFIELPEDRHLAAMLTAQIDTTVASLTLSVSVGEATLKAVIEPAYIHDVQRVKKRFQLVVETVYEKQNVIGPLLPGMVELDARMIMDSEIMPEENPGPPRGTADARTLQGLHVMLQKPAFQKYIGSKLASGGYHKPEIYDETTAKQGYKLLAGVESCTELDAEYIVQFQKDFNAWNNNCA